jgi:hypothetical protein
LCTVSCIRSQFSFSHASLPWILDLPLSTRTNTIYSSNRKHHLTIQFLLQYNSPLPDSSVTVVYSFQWEQEEQYLSLQPVDVHGWSVKSNFTVITWNQKQEASALAYWDTSRTAETVICWDTSRLIRWFMHTYIEKQQSSQHIPKLLLKQMFYSYAHNIEWKEENCSRYLISLNATSLSCILL